MSENMIPIKFHLRVLLILAVGAWLWACAPVVTTPAPQKLKVLSTTTQVAALAKEIGGDKIELQGLLQANVDPHEFQPTPEDVRAVTNAQVAIKNGLNLEGFLDKLIQASSTKAIVVDASKGVPTRRGDEEFLEGDPHI